MSSLPSGATRLPLASGAATDDVVQFFDTTLRDGEQAPGATLHMEDKLAVAHQLERLGVDVVEAGFPASSPGDFEAVQRIARELDGPAVTGLARAHRGDILAVYQAVREAPKPLIHVFIAVSDVHIEKKLGLSRSEVLRRTHDAVGYARELCPDVQFSPEDAGRANREFLCQVVETAVEAGASVVNLPDTTGYCLPVEFAQLVTTVRGQVRGMDQVLVSVHCHDDLGLATANSLAGVVAGARRVEGCINGLGERAGNAALEEILMALRVRRPQLHLADNLVAKEIGPTSRLVSQLTGIPVAPNKPVVGSNAFAHASGVHQHGVLQDRTTYQIMTAEEVGAGATQIVLTARSGRHALAHRLQLIGVRVSDSQMPRVWARFLEVADNSKEVGDDQLMRIVSETSRLQPDLGMVSG